MSDKVLVLHRCEDGLSIQLVSRSVLIDRLNDGWYGRDINFLNRLPEGGISIDEFPSRSMLIADGDILVPKEVTVVKEYELP